ncbi:MAG: winged helix-turn-helix domain-containing protein [Herpetosiphonaceae bacterium]|nr:winged helix-turn-helix domain-containing protein [Herpetosiphonaceae bacterium]
MSATKPVRRLSPTIARRLAITRQRLAGPVLHADRGSILDTARDLRCLQLDPISAVARSHQLVLHSRLPGYSLDDFHALLWGERQLFEYWAHCASIVLTEDYPIHAAMMRDYLNGDSAWAQRTRAWLVENSVLRTYILDELMQHGPRPSSYFEDSSKVGWSSSGWNGGRNVSRMLDFLWIQGTIMVAGRSGIQKLWDLSERCLPAWTPREQLMDEEVTRRAIPLAVRALGVARPAHIQQHFIRGRYPRLAAAIDELVGAGELVPVELGDEDRAWPGPWYIHTADLPLLDRLLAGDWQPRTTLLSPFDNLICDRARTEALFNFRFRIEIYVPKAKRQYGYYVLPILHGDELIGRIDPLMDRKRQRLVINTVYAESSAPLTLEVGRAVADAISELATFLDAREIEYQGELPAGWRQPLVA